MPLRLLPLFTSAATVAHPHCRRQVRSTGRIHPLFTEAFLGILGARGVESVKIPAQSPNCNPHAERFVRTIKYECLNQFIIFGERHLRRLIKEFVEHYMTERFHQGLGGQLISKQLAPTNHNSATGKVVRRSRLGGMLNYYSREAA